MRNCNFKVAQQKPDGATLDDNGNPFPISAAAPLLFRRPFSETSRHCHTNGAGVRLMKESRPTVAPAPHVVMAGPRNKSAH